MKFWRLHDAVSYAKLHFIESKVLDGCEEDCDDAFEKGEENDAKDYSQVIERVMAAVTQLTSIHRQIYIYFNDFDV